MKQRLYLDGDMVIIDKFFIIADSTSKFIHGDPIIVIIKKGVYTPTHGWSYSLSHNKKRFPVCYWESDILEKYHGQSEEI